MNHREQIRFTPYAWVPYKNLRWWYETIVFASLNHTQGTNGAHKTGFGKNLLRYKSPENKTGMMQIGKHLLRQESREQNRDDPASLLSYWDWTKAFLNFFEC